MDLEDCLKDEVPLWQIEDQLTEARQKAQCGNRKACEEATKKALEMLQKTPEELIDLGE